MAQHDATRVREEWIPGPVMAVMWRGCDPVLDTGLVSRARQFGQLSSNKVDPRR